MKHFCSICIFFSALILTCPIGAQTLTGSTTIDVDPATNIVTATCETDEDDGDYEADVQCTVTDAAFNVKAQQSAIDHGGQGYAQVVLTFTGQAGTNYIATSTHQAIANITDLPDGHGPTYYEDYYNYSSFEQAGDITYPFSYEWYGPGPDVQIRNKNIRVGNTTASDAIAPVITLSFSGSKNALDLLTFAPAGVCSESLGLTDCPDYWSWNLEGNALVTDDASKWTVNQSFVSVNDSFYVKDSGGVLHHMTQSAGSGADGPAQQFLQQTSGTKNIFWIDSPGPPKFAQDPTSGVNDPVDSVTSSLNFSVSICSSLKTTVCSNATWYVKIVVNPGQQLDSTNSSAAVGTAP
jgi:hypothetical protein